MPRSSRCSTPSWSTTRLRRHAGHADGRRRDRAEVPWPGRHRHAAAAHHATPRTTCTTTACATAARRTSWTPSTQPGRSSAPTSRSPRPDRHGHRAPDRASPPPIDPCPTLLLAGFRRPGLRLVPQRRRLPAAARRVAASTRRRTARAASTPSSPYDNVPVLSWLLLRGRCRGCGSRSRRATRSSRRPPGCSASLSSLTATTRPSSRSGSLWSRSSCRRADRPRAPIIPNAIAAPAADRRARDRSSRSTSGDRLERLIAGAGGRRVLFLAALAYPRGMGMGDVKLAGVIGPLPGPRGRAAMLSRCRRRRRRRRDDRPQGRAEGRKTAVPFGPFLALGGVVALFVGDGARRRLPRPLLDRGIPLRSMCSGSGRPDGGDSGLGVVLPMTGWVRRPPRRPAAVFSSGHKRKFGLVGLDIEPGGVAVAEVAVNGGTRNRARRVCRARPGIVRDGEVVDAEALSRRCARSARDNKGLDRRRPRRRRQPRRSWSGSSSSRRSRIPQGDGGGASASAPKDEIPMPLDRRSSTSTRLARRHARRARASRVCRRPSRHGRPPPCTSSATPACAPRASTSPRSRWSAPCLQPGPRRRRDHVPLGRRS